MKTKFFNFIEAEKQKPYFQELISKIKHESMNHLVLPAEDKVFECFKYFEPEETKVIIIGQDPYATKGVADGLAFSTQKTICPKSLQNIIKEIKRDYPNAKVETNSLVSWAKQKVLLLNTTLTVNENQPNSHKTFGWKIFVNNVLDYIATNNQKFILVLWGNEALNNMKSFIKRNHISEERIIYASHPSPLANIKINDKSFVGSHMFKRINDLLDEKINFDLRKE